MEFKKIKQLTRNPNYKINVSWNYLEISLKRYKDHYDLELNPDFQRGHVWTREQQEKYIEFKLRGGAGSDIIMFNCSGWGNNFEGPMVLVDGKQRITAVLKFLNNKIWAFGNYYSEFEDRLPQNIDFIFHINDLKERKDVLQWYLEMNSYGTPHTKEELENIKRLLEKENVRST